MIIELLSQFRDGLDSWVDIIYTEYITQAPGMSTEGQYFGLSLRSF